MLNNIINKIYHKSGQGKNEGKIYEIGAKADNIYIDLKENSGLQLTLQQWFDYMKQNLKKVSTICNKRGKEPTAQDEIWIDYK